MSVFFVFSIVNINIHSNPSDEYLGNRRGLYVVYSVAMVMSCLMAFEVWRLAMRCLLVYRLLHANAVAHFVCSQQT